MTTAGKLWRVEKATHLGAPVRAAYEEVVHMAAEDAGDAIDVSSDAGENSATVDLVKVRSPPTSPQLGVYRCKQAAQFMHRSVNTCPEFGSYKAAFTRFARVRLPFCCR